MKTLKIANKAGAVALGCVVAGAVAFAQEVAPEAPAVPVEPPVAVEAPAPVAAEPAASCAGLSYTPGEGISFDEQPVMTAEFSLAFDSRYMTYGVIDGKDPIVTPGATATFFDFVYFGVEAIFDTTKQQGKKWGGYGNRAGKYTTLDAIVGGAHDFDLGETLGALSVDFNYIYEYIPRYHGEVGDTQYLNLELALNDLWLEPTFAIERDLMADDGTYFNFNIGHTFTLVGDEEEPELALTLSFVEGLANNKYNEDDLGCDSWGFRETTLMAELEWAAAEFLSVKPYISYSDHLNGHFRHPAHYYADEEASHKVAQLYGGVAVELAF